jgi:hypothetical protein
MERQVCRCIMRTRRTNRYKCYDFALKTFQEDNKELFDAEIHAFQFLKDQKGFIRYLDHYTHVKPTRNSLSSTPRIEASASGTTQRHSEGTSKLTYNILLEYAQYDLDDLFNERAPPVMFHEIVALWQNLFDLADALNGIHNLTVANYDLVREYST